MIIDIDVLGTLCAELGFELERQELEPVASKVARVNEARAAAGERVVELVDAAGRIGCGPYSRSRNSSEFSIQGQVEPGYEVVQAAFTANFESGAERNAQLCIYQDGLCVVDLWGENQEPGISTAPTSGYDGDTIQSVYSSGKALECTVIAMAVERGLCRYTDKVSDHWPEFAANGKAHLTIADVLRHDAGLHAFDEPFSKDDVNDQTNRDGNISRIIAAQAPWTWAEGEFKGRIPRIYHAVSRGYILSQILMRVDPRGRTVGQWMVEELCGPLQADFYCGPHDSKFAAGDTPEAEMHYGTRPDAVFRYLHRDLPGIIRTTFPNRFEPTSSESALARLSKHPLFPHSPEQDLQGRVNTGPDGNALGYKRDAGDADSRLLEITSSSNRASARGMARVMGMLANGGELDGVRILNRASIYEAVKHPISGSDRPNGPFGMAESVKVQGGWWSVAKSRFGGGGAGGSLIQFNLVNGVGMGYTCTGFSEGLAGDQDRVGLLVLALNEALKAQSKRRKS